MTLRNQSMGRASRRFAANRVVHCDLVYTPGFVEILDGMVRNCGRLDHEMTNTEWLGGTIELTDTASGLQARWNGEILNKR